MASSAKSQSQSPEPKRSRMVADKEEEEPVPNDQENSGDSEEEDQHKQAEAFGKMCKVVTNPIIMKNIGGYLNAQALLNLREANPDWNHSVIPQLISKHSPIQLDFDLDEDEDYSVENFIEDVKSSSMIPFSNYELLNCREDLLEFGPAIGHTVKKLSIHWFWDEYWMTSKVRQLIFEQLPQLTDLEFLFPGSGDWEPTTPEELTQLIQSTTTSSWSDHQLSNLKRFTFNFAGQEPLAAWQLVSELVHCATELEELWLPAPGLNEEGQHTYERFLKPVLQDLRDSNTSLHKLKHLEIGSVNVSILEALLEIARRPVNALSLQTFSISIIGGGWLEPDGVESDAHAQDEEFYDRHRSEMMQMLKTFLETQEPTLKDLSLWLCHDGITLDPVPITLPEMTQLRALTISNPERIEDEDAFPHLQFDGATFESTFPRLKKLNYDIDEENDGGEFRKVSHSELAEMFLKVKIGIAIDLPTLFPSLTRLDLCLRYCHRDTGKDMDKAEEYAKIWTLWPSLTHMKLNFRLISNSVNPDKLLTGVPGRQLGALKAELDTLVVENPPTLQELDALVRKYKTRPGIANLRQLKEFELNWLPDIIAGAGWVNQLSDTAVYCGLALVGPQLRKITFVDEVGDLLSEDCLKFMKTQGEHGGHIFPDVVINFE